MKGVSRVTWMMLGLILVMVPLVFLIDGLSKVNWFEALLFVVAVAEGLTPGMLPMIVTVNLAKGAMAMSKKRVIVKRLNAIQSFGAMDMLCTDKTGTLTQDKIILKRHLDLRGEESDRVLEYAYLNSFHQSGLRNLLDVAVLDHVELKDNVDDEYLAKPRRWDIANISEFVFLIGPISSIFRHVTFFVMLTVFHAWDKPALFQTGWFVESLLTQTLIIHINRTARLPFLWSRASAPMIATSLIIAVVGIILPYTWFGATLGFVPLPWNYWIVLCFILLSYTVLTHLIKSWCSRRFGLD